MPKYNIKEALNLEKQVMYTTNHKDGDYYRSGYLLPMKNLKS